MDFTGLDDDSLRKVFSYLSFKDHFHLSFVDQRFANVVYSACKYIYVKLIVKDLKDQQSDQLDVVFYQLITGKADEEFKLKYQIFNYVEKLNLEYRIDEPIDLTFMSRLRELNLNFAKGNGWSAFLDEKEYPNVKKLFVRDYNARYQKLFPNVTELGCKYIHDIQPTDSVKLICISSIYPDELSKFRSLKMISLELSSNLFSTSQLPHLLTRIPTLDKLHINFLLRKNTLSMYTRAITRLVNIKIENKLSLELCIHLSSNTKDHPTTNTYTYRKSEIKLFKESAQLFISHLVSLQINEVELTYDTIPDSVQLFSLIGQFVASENDLIPFISKNIGLYLKNLRTVKLTQGSDHFFDKLANLIDVTRLKAIEINCRVEQKLLNSIHFKNISSFALLDQGKYDIGFLLNMRHLRTLTLRIDDFQNIADLLTIVSNCIFLNYLTINLKHFAQIKDDLIDIYQERSKQYPFTSIILTVIFDPVMSPAQTSYDKITDRFSIHILPAIS